MDKIKSLVINDSGFAFDPYTGETYTINETGAMIVRDLREGASVGKISEKFAKDFNVSKNAAYTDILEFRNQLVIHGLLEVCS